MGFHFLDPLGGLGIHRILGLCRDNGKENGNYYLGFRGLYLLVVE